MGDITITFRDTSQFEAYMRDIVETQKYGEVKSVTVTDSGALLFETASGKVLLQPELPPPNDQQDVQGAYGVLGSQVDTLFELMATLTKTLREMRAANRVSREIEHQTQVNELLQAADKIREAGKKALIGAIVGFAVSVAMAAISIGVSVKAAKAELGKMNAANKLGGAQESVKQAETKLTEAQKGLQEARQATNLGDAVRDAKEALQQAHATQQSAQEAMKAASRSAAMWSGTASAAPSMGQSASQLVGGVTQYEQSLSQAEEKIHETKAEEHSFQAQKDSDQIQALQELIQSVLDKLKTIMELQQQAVDHVSRV
ncbi:MAG: type III secretion system translocon subunit SctB [Thermodesulforhabdaceae bacterium]|jgi:DNA repair exonuclease SbcCD ATPase subunit